MNVSLQDVITEEAIKSQILPTLSPYESSSQEQEDEEMSSEDNSNPKQDDEEVVEKKTESTAVLLSEEELVDLLEKEAKEEDEEGEGQVENDGAEASTNVGVTKDEEKFREDKTLTDSLEAEKRVKDQEEVRGEIEEVEEEERIKNVLLDKKPAGMMSNRTELVGPLEGSTDSELPVDLDYAADGEILQPLQRNSTKVNPSADDTPSDPNKDFPGGKMKEGSEKEQLSPAANESDMQTSEAGIQKDTSDQHRNSSLKSEEKIHKKTSDRNEDPQELKGSVGLKSGSQKSEKEAEKRRNEIGTPNKKKTRKSKKNQRSKKHSPQRNETLPAQEQNHQDPQESEGSSTEGTVPKAKKRRAGKWVIYLKICFTLMSVF